MTDSMSLLVIGLFRFSISYFILVGFVFLRNLSIAFRLSKLLAYNSS